MGDHVYILLREGASRVSIRDLAQYMIVKSSPPLNSIGAPIRRLCKPRTMMGSSGFRWAGPWREQSRRKLQRFCTGSLAGTGQVQSTVS